MVLIDVIFFSFFFQAEDGIRDLTVTGVQTCALPISGTCAPPPYGGRRHDVRHAVRVGPARVRRGDPPRPPQRRPPARLRSPRDPSSGGRERGVVGEEGRSRGAPRHLKKKKKKKSRSK